MQTQPEHEHLQGGAPAEPDPWLEDLDELPPRPRRTLLAPAPLALLAVLLIACGFIGGVLVEKGQSSSSAGTGAAGGFAARLRAAAAAGGGTSAAAAPGRAAAGGASGAAGGGFAGRGTSGTVAYTSGDTLYVTEGESNTVEVRTSAATSVTKTVKSSVHAIHPGEIVTVTGAAGANGTVSAEAIRVGSTGGLAALFGGGASPGTSGKGGSSGGPALFGSG